MWGCSYIGMCMYMCASGCQHSCQDLHNIIFPHMDSVAHCILIYPVSSHATHAANITSYPGPCKSNQKREWSPWQHSHMCWVGNLDLGMEKSHSAAASLDSHNSHLAYKDFPLSHRGGSGNVYVHVCVFSVVILATTWSTWLEEAWEQLMIT